LKRGKKTTEHVVMPS